MRKRNIREIANSFVSYEELYEQAVRGDLSNFSRRLGTTEYPEKEWMLQYFAELEEYEKCAAITKMVFPDVSEEDLEKEKQFMKDIGCE
jgi:hypothetical protein